jgi:hypothetical protein
VSLTLVEGETAMPRWTTPLILGLVLVAAATPSRAYQRLYNAHDGAFVASVADITLDPANPICALSVRSRAAPGLSAFAMASELRGDTVDVRPVRMARLASRRGGIRVVDGAAPPTLEAAVEDVFSTRDGAHMLIRLGVPREEGRGTTLAQLATGTGFAIEVALDGQGDAPVAVFEGPVVARALKAFHACLARRDAI